MPLKGALRDFSLPDLFQLIHFGKKNGTLVIANGDMMGYVCFRNGNVFFATHNWKRAPLGQRLIESGMITEEQLDEALELQSTTKGDQRVGNILVDLGYLSRESLEVFVEEHIRDAVFNLLRWSEGDFDFDPDQIFPEEDIGLSMSTEDLIMEGSRRLDEWFQIEKKVPSLDAVFKMTKAPGKDASEMNLTSEEWLVIYHVDGESTVRDIIVKSGQSALVTCKALYGLVTAGMVALVEEPMEAPATGAAGLEDEVDQMLEAEAAAAPADEEEISIEAEEELARGVEAIGADQERPRKRLARSKKKQSVPEDETISFGDDADDTVTVEEVMVEETPEEVPRRSRLRRKSRKPEEVVVEEASETETVPVEEAAGEAAGAPAAEEERQVEQLGPTGAPPEGAPAPGQSLVDYYKSLALRDFGDSEIYRETEERRAFMEQAEKGVVGEADQHEFEILGSDAQAESPALTEEPQDIPLEWAGHLTRMRGRSAQPSLGKARKAEEEETGEPEGDVLELDAYAALKEEAARVEDEMAAEPAVEPEIPEPTVEAADAADREVEASALVDEEQPVPELIAEPEDGAQVSAAQAELIEAGLDDDILTGALEAISAASVPPGSEDEEAELVEEEAEVEVEEEAEVEVEEEAEIEAEEAEVEAEEDVESETREAEPAADSRREGVDEGIPEVPILDESVEMDDTSLPTEEDMEKLIQVNPPSREDLSREELLAFDQPTYAIQETREAGSQAQGEEPVEVGGGEPERHAELEETVARAEEDDGRRAPSEAGGTVVPFSRAQGEVDVEVVLEHPEPVVKSATVETLSVAQDLQVPVFEEALGQAVAELVEPEAEAFPLEEDEEVESVLRDAPDLVEGAEMYPEDLHAPESVLEIVGLDELLSDARTEDSVQLSVAEELELGSSEAEIDESPAELEIHRGGLAAPGEEIAEEIAALEAEIPEVPEQEPIVTSGAETQQVAFWGDAATDTEAIAEAVPTEPVDEQPSGVGAVMDYDHIDDLRDIASERTGEQAAASDEAEEAAGPELDVEAGLAPDLEVEEAVPPALEVEAAAAPDTEVEVEPLEAESAYEEDEEEDEDDGGLMGSLKVSGKRGKGTSLVDLETFELEQELLELAGGVQQRKQKVVIEKPPTKPESPKKEKKGWGSSRSKGKEVDKGSVKKIIDDLKNK